jgi:hypothetical protein
MRKLHCREGVPELLAAATVRHDLIQRGQRLQYFTIIYNCLEGILSVGAGMMAGSVSLIGFGLDSVIEVTSGMAVIWRLRQDKEKSRRDQV